MVWCEECSFSNLSLTSRTSQFILQPFLRFSYVTSSSLNSSSRAHSPTLPLLHLRHSSFSNPSISSTSQVLHLIHLAELILQPFRHFTYVTTHSPTLTSLYLRHSSSPTFPLLHLRHRPFPNPSIASPTSQAIHLIHLACRPCVFYVISSQNILSAITCEATCSCHSQNT